mgnify:CR=1 FL=1
MSHCYVPRVDLEIPWMYVMRHSQQIRASILKNGLFWPHSRLLQVCTGTWPITSGKLGDSDARELSRLGAKCIGI